MRPVRQGLGRELGRFLGCPVGGIFGVKIFDPQVGVEYIYTENPTAAVPTDEAELTPGSLAGWPQGLIDPMREAVITADLDQLLATIQNVDARDPHVAQGLRRLAEGFEYEKLLDLFSTGNAYESGTA
jgi:hypothetical protein